MEVLSKLKPGQHVPVKLVQQNGKTRNVQVTLGELHGS